MAIRKESERSEFCKVKRGNLEQCFVFRTSYSDEFCWMSEKGLVIEVHLAQSEYSRQTWISLAFQGARGTNRRPCNKMADGVTWNTVC